MKLIKKINQIKNSSIKEKIDIRLNEFKDLNSKTNKEWFSELCFCLLTANTSADLGMRVQNKLGYKGFTSFQNEKDLALRLKNANYRFYNRRAHFIVLANRFKNIKFILQKFNTVSEKREWLVNNIKGIGYKEASHFLRNVGFFNVAILDKHVLRLLLDYNLIKNIPASLNKNKYLKFENILEKIANKINISQGELDLYLWYIQTNKVLK
jgi:N-glycosylase/DNA lyase